MFISSLIKNAATSALALTIFGAPAGLAGTIAIANPSFETPVQTCPGCFTLLTSIPGSPWVTAMGLASVYRPTVGPGQSFLALPDGNQVTPIGFSGNGSEIFQDLSATLLSNTTYTLSYFVGQRADYPMKGYTVSLEANNGSTHTVLASDSGGAPAPGLFIPRTIVFNSGSSPHVGETLRIDISTPAGNNQADFDLFALSTADAGVPEPSSLTLQLCALAFAGAFLRKRP